MKKYFFLLSFLFLFIGKEVAAEDGMDSFQLKNDPQYQEILALAPEAQTALDFVYQEKTGATLPEDVALDLGTALKIYVADYLLAQDFSQQKVAKFLEQCPVLWYYEKEIAGTTYLLEITKGQPIDESIKWSEEERAYLESVAGRWHVSGKGYRDEGGLTHNLQQVDRLNLGASYLVTGLRLLQTPTLLVVQDQQPTALYPLTEIQILDEAGQTFYGGATKRSSLENPLVFAKGKYGAAVLDYALVQQIVVATPVTTAVGTSGVLDMGVLQSKNFSTVNVLLLVASVSVAVVVLGVVAWRVQKRRYAHDQDG